MPALSPTSPLFIFACVLLVITLGTPALAFGAGNIVSVSSAAGKNWRHGDIEDTLLELFMSAAGRAKFDRLAVKRVYFGNWLRDYSQAVDVGGLKQLPKDTIRVMLWVLSFVTFGFATGEFEVTEQRLGCYRPEEHIDNPKDYADNEDARKYDSRLRGPVDEAKELAIDELNGMKAYIASENRGIDTSAGFVRKCFVKAIELGRKFGRDGNDADLYEALRLLGTGLHTLEDFAAHSNYVELALRELGVDAFPHVGANCEVDVNGKTIWPIVTGTFGMTDFLHSVVGEISDKMIQSEVQTLEDKISDASSQSHSGSTSTLRQILDMIPFGLLGFGDNDFGDQAQKIQEQSDAKELETKAKISSPNQTVEDIKRQAVQTAKEIYPILEFHDKVMKAITEGIDKVPGVSEVLENLTGAMQIYIFSVLAPYIMPILEKVKLELAAGSDGILKASEKGQYVVFNDDRSSNPTHSMISKDHFTNVLNEPAGQVASEIVRFVVPLITAAWDDENRDPNEVVNQAIQVLHHPALRSREGQKRMFEVVRAWWEGKSRSEQRHIEDALSKDGVKEGRNHEGDDPVGGPGSKSHSHSSCAHSQGGSDGRQQQRRYDGGGPRQQDEYGGYQQRRQEEPSGYGRREERSEGYQQRVRQSDGRNNGDREEQRQTSGENTFGIGGGLGGLISGVVCAALTGGNGSESQSGGYGRGEEATARHEYGEETTSYDGANRRRQYDREGESSGDYSGQQGTYDTNTSRGLRSQREESAYSSGGYERRHDQPSYSSGGYGSRRNDEPSYSSEYSSQGNVDRSYSGGYGGQHNDEESYNFGGYGRGHRDELEDSYSGGRRRNEEEEGSHGGRRGGYSDY
ncbi:heterokaryon incompatibility protein Het-C-domain-containing protein [Kalaharituber pfeilii]|nr:heterokaryon incompatibility protein Het-C-domain-containing protein [Kalaharituber pfeilii]